MRIKKLKLQGFTLIELLFVIIVAGIIAAIAIPRLATTSDAAKESANKHNIGVINTSVERWYLEKGSYPESDLSDIGTDVKFFPDGLPINPIDGSSYELDPITNRVAIETEE
jgi:general secretion pathway protein G